MHKIITSSFELDLSTFKISIVEENHWFGDVFFTKYSFPFDINLDTDLLRPLGYLLDHLYVGGETLFECTYVHGNKMERAIFEIEQLQGFSLSASLRYGFDELPTFSKKLSELSLDKFDLPEGVNIYDYAATIIPQTWPAVNFNFPQVHIDKIDTDSDLWFAFDKIINNYKNGEFLKNDVDIEEEITYNRNIIQPLPYYLHILTRGFADDGYVLKGDITTDPYFLKKCLYADVEYATTVEQPSIPFLVMGSDAIVYQGKSNYGRTETIIYPGRYRIIGTISLKAGPEQSWWKLKYRNVVIASRNETWSYGAFIDTFTFVSNINIVIDTLSDLQLDEITFDSHQYQNADEEMIVNIDINPIRLHDESGEAIPTVQNLNKIDLPRAVPDMTFGDFVKYIKNKYNMDCDPRGNEMYMNFIQNQVADLVPFDLSDYEVNSPVRKFNKGMSFLLKVQDVESKDYTFPPVFQSATELSNVENSRDEKTQEIVLDGLPLPLLVRNGVQTAHAFETGNKIYTVLYDGLSTNGLNLTKDPTMINLPAVHDRCYRKWMEDRIVAQVYEWPFKMTPEVIRDLVAKGKVFAYGRNHVVKTINKTQVREDLWEVDIITESLK